MKKSKGMMAEVGMMHMEPKISFDFPKGGGLKVPDGFKDLTIDKEIVVVVKGTICEICGEKEYGSPGFRVKPTSVEIEGKIRKARP